MPYPPQMQAACTTRWNWWSRSARAAPTSQEADALRHVWGYAAGLDMTRRDLQNAAKKEGKPWDMGKGFDHSAPIGLMVPAAKIGHPAKGLIELKVNGKVRQTSDLSKMIWNVPETIAYLSRPGAAGAGRPDLHRHAGGRRGGAARRPAGRRGRGRRHGADPHRLMPRARREPTLRVATWNINSLRLRLGAVEGAGRGARSRRDLPAGDQGAGRAVSGRGAGGARLSRMPCSAA